jgi:DHA1 family bicyclomycin/chloramphenicol resistance-like MFS transporter
MTICGLVALAVSITRLPETNLARDPDASPRKMVAGFPALARLPSFRALVLVLASTSGAFFAFIGASPYIVVEVMGRGPDAYGLWFVFVSVGYMAGNFCSGRFARTVGIEPFMTAGTALAMAAMAVTAAAILAFGWQPAALFVPMLIFSFGNGLTMPCATAATLSVRPELAGAAAGLSGAVQLGLGALGSMIASMGVVHTPWALLLVMATVAFIGLAAALAYRRMG